MGAGTPSLGPAGAGEAAGSLAEFPLPDVSMANTPGSRGALPQLLLLFLDLCEVPILRESGFPGEQLCCSRHPESTPALPPSPARPGAGSGITCREECGSHAGNELLGWGLLPGGHQTLAGSTNSFLKRPLFLRLPGIQGSPGLQPLPRISAHPS